MDRNEDRSIYLRYHVDCFVIIFLCCGVEIVMKLNWSTACAVYLRRVVRVVNLNDRLVITNIRFDWGRSL